jgi:NAD kinase
MRVTTHLTDQPAGFEKIVLVTRKTRLAELVERFNTLAQAKFYIEHAGRDFQEYQLEDDAYRRSAEIVRRSLEVGLKLQEIDRGLVPTFTFLPGDVVITLGQDGLVANTAKYIGKQPLLAVNPDPERFDGILLPFAPHQTGAALTKVIEGKCHIRSVTLAEARMRDGQRLLAFNDRSSGHKLTFPRDIEFGGQRTRNHNPQAAFWYRLVQAAQVGSRLSSIWLQALQP